MNYNINEIKQLKKDNDNVLVCLYSDIIELHEKNEKLEKEIIRLRANLGESEVLRIVENPSFIDFTKEPFYEKFKTIQHFDNSDYEPKLNDIFHIGFAKLQVVKDSQNKNKQCKKCFFHTGNVVIRCNLSYNDFCMKNNLNLKAIKIN